MAGVAVPDALLSSKAARENGFSTEFLMAALLSLVLATGEVGRVTDILEVTDAVVSLTSVTSSARFPFSGNGPLFPERT